MSYEPRCSWSSGWCWSWSLARGSSIPSLTLFSSLHFIFFCCVFAAGLDLKLFEGSQSGCCLADSPAPPCGQQDVKIKAEARAPAGPKKTQVSVTPAASDPLTLKPPETSFCPPAGVQTEEHGLLGQSGSEVSVHARLPGALLQRQLRAVPPGGQGEGGEGAAAESAGPAGAQGAGEAAVRATHWRFYFEGSPAAFCTQGYGRPQRATSTFNFCVYYY